MTKDKPEFIKEVALINREKGLTYLRDYINIRPESILFIHGPKSSGKTTLLYKLFDQIQKEQKPDVKFLNLRKTLTEEDAEKIWELVGGSMWEIQDILDELFHTPLDNIIQLYKKKMPVAKILF